MGCKSYFGALRVLLNLKRKLNLEFMNIKLTNIVVTFSAKTFGDINLARFYELSHGYANYNPSIFPCVTYRIPNTKIKANIFHSGKVVVAGCRNRTTIEESIHHILGKIRASMDV